MGCATHSPSCFLSTLLQAWGRSWPTFQALGSQMGIFRWKMDQFLSQLISTAFWLCHQIFSELQSSFRRKKQCLQYLWWAKQILSYAALQKWTHSWRTWRCFPLPRASTCAWKVHPKTKRCHHSGCMGKDYMVSSLGPFGQSPILSQRCHLQRSEEFAEKV